MRQTWAIALALILPGCGNAGDADARRAQEVAQQFGADCRRTEAPNPNAVRELARLCSCTTARISASDIAVGHSDDAISERVHAAQDFCLREVYGDEPATAANST